MRILIANKFWYRRAGLERVMFDEIEWLTEAGHEVAHYSTSHPENDPSPWSGYFAPYLEIGPHTTLSTRVKAVAVGRMFWNAPAAAHFGRLLKDFRPDIVHVHGIHRQVSPSILFAARRARIPVVQTLHDYHPICASGDLLRGGRFDCEPPRCGKVDVTPCLTNSCVHQRRDASVLGAAELLWRRWVLQYERLVDVFISPSRHLARLVTAGGVTSVPMRVIPNAIPAPASPSSDAHQGEGFLYAGRISREKGLPTLLRAAALAGVPLQIAGTGPLYDELNARPPGNIRFLGRLPGVEIDRLLAGCRAAVVPSEWAENAPMAVLEPMVLGRPVVATRMGGIPEQVRDGVDGILVPPRDPEALASAMRTLADDAELAARMGRAGRQRATTVFSPETHLDALLDVYSMAARTAARRN